MKEIRSLLKLYRKEENKAAALATVINVEGSSYRRTGARMLIYEDGTWKGGISGGCLENDVLKNAKLVMLHQEVRTIRYDTTEGDSNNIGVGLGCNGIIDILISPIKKGHPNNPLEVLESYEKSRVSNLLISVINNETNLSLEPGDMFHFPDSEHLNKIITDTELSEEIKKDVSEVASKKRTRLKSYEHQGKDLQLLFEILPPNIHLVIVGNNYDIYPISDLASVMGWDISLVANPLKIDKSILKKVKLYPAGGGKYPQVKTDKNTAVLMMSHDYKTDLTHLKHYISADPGYIGLLGPRKRGDKLFSELEEAGISLAGQKDTIFSPTGLDIGAESPEEIALSILSEIKTVFAERQGGFLRKREGSIHER